MNMDEDELDKILNAVDFKAIKQLALEAPDFSGRRRGLAAVRIDRFTLGALIEQINTYTSEKSEVIDESFKNGYAAQEALKKEWVKFDDVTQDSEIFSPIKSQEESLHAYYSFGYQHSLQLNAILIDNLKKMANALAASYGGQVMTAEERTAITRAAEMAKELARQLEGLAALGRVKEAGV